MTDLGSEDGVANSEAVFINSRTQIVGYSFSCDLSVVDALMWEGGSVVNLNSLISQTSAFHLFFTAFINDQGEIGAFGSLPDGDIHAFVLIPCDDDHPIVDGCDYSLVEASATVNVATRMPRANMPATASPGVSREAIRQLLQCVGSAPWRRRFGAQPQR